jgi:ABC-2 type transport system ATP-binding protein
MIDVERLSKRYGTQTVLDEAGFRALPGQITVVTGDNGSGKSTLLRILAGVAGADGGSAKIMGTDVVSDRRRAQASLSFLPQGVAFHPDLTPELLVRFYARLRRLSSGQGDVLLQRLELVGERHKPVRKLSGGAVQRVGLALLLLPDAPVLLLDEPAISLDPQWRRRLSDLLQAERDVGKTVLLTTHLPSEWEGEADSYLRCQGGKVVVEAGSRGTGGAPGQGSSGVGIST